MKGSKQRRRSALARNDLLKVGSRVHWPFSEAAAATRPLPNTDTFSSSMKYKNLKLFNSIFLQFNINFFEKLRVENNLLSWMGRCRRRVSHWRQVLMRRNERPSRKVAKSGFLRCFFQFAARRRTKARTNIAPLASQNDFPHNMTRL